MRLDLDRTIVAVSSPLAPAARGIIRLSGSQTVEILSRTLRDSVDLEQAARRAFASRFSARFDLGWSDRLLDISVYLWPNARSFTGESCAELHCVGSLPIVHRVVRRLTECGASPAERGEFALRAFLAGKLDLVQAEAVLGVIESDQPEQLDWALEQLAGNISRPVRQLRSELMEILAHLEAGLDFVEEDIEFISHDQLSEKLGQIESRVESLVAQLDSRGVVNRQLEIALVGSPNAGKSSIFNALLGTGRAIVSATAGTTRDIVAAELTHRGLTVRLLDTAGLETIDDSSPRAAAQQLLEARLRTCDAILVCLDMSSFDLENVQSRIVSLGIDSLPKLYVGTKLDLAEQSELHQLDCTVSIYNSASLLGLADRLIEFASTQIQGKFTQATHHTAIRCCESLQRAGESLRGARSLVENDVGEELIASELHCVLEDLSSIIGEVHNDDILGEIFSRFCIGK